MLGEKKQAFTMVIEPTWERRPDFLALNPAGDVPVLADGQGLVLADATAIAEYLDETVAEPSLLGDDAAGRAEVRRLVGWFDDKFNREVTINLVGEKLVKRQMGRSESPDSRAVREGYSFLPAHLDYLGALAERRRWLAGERISLADFTAAAHVSAVDYLGDIPWERYPQVKDWYARVKSRPSFRPLLTDHLPGMPPPAHYADLDF